MPKSPAKEQVIEYGLILLPAVGLVVAWVWPAAWPILVATSVIAGIPTVLGAFRGLLDRRINIDAFNSLALCVSYVTQEWQSAAFITLMLGFARWLDGQTERGSHRALEELLKLKPITARREKDGVIEDIPSEQIRVGDVLIVPTGSRVPADGVVIHGTGFLNQAPITGESAPVEKVYGDAVLASTLVEAGSIKMRATAVGGDSTLERMAALVTEAQKHKSRPEVLADRFAALFMPVVGLVGLATWVFTHDAQKVAAVFLVACADDMAVAIPLAITAALGQAARRGVLVKGGSRLAQLAAADTLVLDKTGTLTYGDLRVERLERDPRLSEGAVWECIAIAEKFSEHAVGRALFREAIKHAGHVEDPDRFEAVVGQGVVARVYGHDVLVGTAELLRNRDVHFNGAWLEGSTTPIDASSADAFLAIDGECVGRLRVTDVARPEARESLARLRKLGFKKLLMMTGDTHTVAASVARNVGISEYKSAMKPEDKLREVERLASKGRVAMVGDGVNDAPALARADVGIAMGSGTATTIETADVVILTDDLRRIPELVELARRTQSVVRGDMWIWVATNVLGFALALTGVIGPALAALYNFLTDFLPLINSARLFSRRPAKR